MKVERNIVERIGIPAVLETCAEECNELAKACLKLSRKLRNEQPTPKTLEELIASLSEEIGDVISCMGVIMDETELISDAAIFHMAESKQERWVERIDEFLKEKV